MNIEEVMQTDGTFVGTLPLGALCKLDLKDEGLVHVIIEAEVKAYDQDHVHVEVLMFRERRATKLPIFRHLALMQMQTMGTYIPEMEWARVVQA